MSRREPAQWMRTIQVALPTPYAKDGTVAADALRGHVAALAADGIAGFLPGAGTGEFHSLTAAEVETCVVATREAVGDRGGIIAPVGFALDETIARGKRLMASGADGLLVMPPIHPYIADAGFEAFLRRLHGATGAPLMVYKKAATPSDALLATLVAEGVLTGVKYAINDVAAVSGFADRIDGRPALHCGTGERYAPFFMMAGACGFSSGAANLCPRLCLRMLAACQAGDFATAMTLSRLIRPIEDIRGRDGDALSVGVLKLMLARAGREFGNARPPLRDPTPAENREIIAALEPILAAENAALRVAA